MSINKDLKDLLQCLNAAGAEYLLVGAYAVIYYTEPRYTKDADLWINPNSENAEKVYVALAKFGAPIKHLTVADLCNPEMVYQMGMEPNRIDILMGLSGLGFTQAWKNRKKIKFDGQPVYVLDLNDLIRNKKACGRQKDLIDLQQLNLAKKKLGKKKIRLKT